jgi:acyl-CoA synthetase (AMP-forming)/AMP-acid ligase II
MESPIKLRLYTLHDYILDISYRCPDKDAVIFHDKRYKYSELVKAALALSHYLRNVINAIKGDRVLILAKNSPEHIIAVLGCMFSGCIFVPVNHNIRIDKLTYILGDIRPKVIITDWRKDSGLMELIRTSNITSDIISLEEANGKVINGDPRHRFFSIIDAGTNYFDGSIIDRDIACVIYTSGSSGFPKGVVLSHLNMLTAATSIISYLDLSSDDVIMCTLPLSFDYGMYQYLMSLLLGAALVLEDSFVFVGDIITSLVNNKCTVFPVIPSMISILIKKGPLSEDSTDSIRIVTNTAARLEKSHINYIMENFRKARIFSMYGLTECKRVSYLPPEEIVRRGDSVGKGMPNQEIFLVDADMNRLPNGTTGQLVVRGSHVMRGYWGNPAETGKFLKKLAGVGDVALHTGDIFRSDEDGYLYFIGRDDDIIKSYGEKVSPREIEKTINSMDGILESAAVGVPDPVAGNIFFLYFSVKPEFICTEEQVMAYCRMHLEPHVVPKKVIILDELPKSDNGKIDKKQLLNNHVNQS